MVEYSVNGDQHLATRDHKIYNLIYHILLKWNTLCYTKWRMFDCQNQVPGLVQVFVPRDSTNRYEIVKFLLSELEHDVYPSYNDGSFRNPGTRVQVLLFDGPTGYLEREVTEKLASEFMKMLRERHDRSRKREEGQPDS